jgi:HD superfamily phosphodiesterase
MMRSSLVDSATCSAVRATLGSCDTRVNEKLTKLSTKASELWERYRYPDWLVTHSGVVGRIAEAIVAGRRPGGEPLDADAVVLAAYLHDIGRSPLLAGDPREHNVLSALILAAEGLTPCAEAARRHAIYCVLDPALAPRTLAEKIVYTADRRGGQAVEDLEARAADTARRHPKYAVEIGRAIPLAKDIEREVFAHVTFSPSELASRVR